MLAVCLVAAVVLYALYSLYSFSLSQPARYRAHPSRPRHNPRDDLEFCSDIPLPNTSLCRNCTTLPASTHSHCIECNATTPTECDDRSPAARNISRFEHRKDKRRFKHSFVNAYVWNHGWFLYLFARSEAPGDKNPTFLADQLMEWALERDPLQVDPTALTAAIGCVVVLVLTGLLLFYMHYRHQMLTYADWTARSAASFTHARDLLLGNQEEVLAEEARKRETTRAGDLFNLDKKVD